MKKKGFTLIELLGVVVVLAGVIILVVPAMLNSVGKSKKESFIMFGRKVLETAKQTVAQSDLENADLSCHHAGTTSAASKVNCCFTFGDLGIDDGGKYAGSVSYVESTDTYTLFLVDGSYMTPVSGSSSSKGTSLSGLDNDANVASFVRSKLYWYHNCARAYSFNENWSVEDEIYAGD